MEEEDHQDEVEVAEGVEQQPAVPVAEAGIEGIRQLAAAILASNATLVADQRQSRNEAKLMASMSPCDGENPAEARAWVRAVDDAARVHPQSAVEVALMTSRGELRRTMLTLIERVQNVQEDGAVAWADIRGEVVSQYVSADEMRERYQHLLSLRRYSDETLASFYRRFRTCMQEAIPDPAEADLRRAIFPALAKGMANDKLARKIFSIAHPTVEALNEVVNGFIRVENEVDALRSESKRRQTGVNATINQVSNDSLQTLALSLERLSTRIAKLESRNLLPSNGGTQQKFREQPNGNWGRQSNQYFGNRDNGANRFNGRQTGWSPKRGDIQCYKCLKFGHIQAHCPNDVMPSQPYINHARGQAREMPGTAAEAPPPPLMSRPVVSQQPMTQMPSKLPVIAELEEDQMALK